MGRHSTIPDLFEDCKTISITNLKQLGYLKPNIIKSGVINWSRNNEVTARIGGSIDMNFDFGTLTLDYSVNKEPVIYNVQIISKQSNLGKGLVWFFVCPNTGKICRKLHLGNKYFLHRTALEGYFYELQTWSKGSRNMKVLYKDLLDEKYCDKIYSKHFKKYYNGKPTKRYLSLLKKIGELPGAIRA